MKRPPTPLEQAAGIGLVIVFVVFVLGICINYSVQDAKSRDARQQYSNDTGCTWSGNEFSGYHMEC